MVRQARLTGFRGRAETFKRVSWDSANRKAHEKKRMDPRFSAACKLDWSRILKKPDPRYSDGRQLAIAARQLGSYRAVFFVVFAKRSGYLNVISIRYADQLEQDLFFQHYP